MKRALTIAAALVVVLSAALLLHERAHDAQKGQTKVELHFLGFTNSSNSALRLARFAVSNMSPWSVEQLEYPNCELRMNNGQNIQLVRSFEGGPKVWRAHEYGISLVYLAKERDQQQWRLIAGFERYEDPVVLNLHRWRFFFSQYLPITVPRWEHVSYAVTEWVSE